MARTRSIKPAFFANEYLAELSAGTRLLFIGLWTIADRDGKLEDRPKRIKAALFPYDNIDLEEGLSKLHNYGFIDRYSVNGINVILINNFVKHQNPNSKEQPSSLPDKPEPAENLEAQKRMVQVQCKDGASTNLDDDEFRLLPITDYPLPSTGNLSPITHIPIMDSRLPITKKTLFPENELPKENPEPKDPPPKYDPIDYYYDRKGTRYRILKKDYLEWFEIFKIFGGNDDDRFMDWLKNRFDWMQNQPEHVQKNWFLSTRKHLEKLAHEAEEAKNHA